MTTFHELPEWATKAQGESILAKLDDILGVPITVEARTKDGVTVTGQTVYLYEGSDDKGYFIQAAPYNGQPVTFMVRKGMQYFIKISSNLVKHYSPSTATGFAENATTVILTYEDVSDVTTFAAIQAVIADIVATYGSNEERVAAGRAALVSNDNPIEIADTWVDDKDGASIDDPMVVVDVDTYETIDGEIKVGAKLQRKYATVYALQFDAPEQEEATEETMIKGLFYRGYGAVYVTNKSYAVNNFCSYNGELYKCLAATSGAFDPTKWQLQSSFQSGALIKINTAEGAPIPYGDYLKVFHNKYDNNDVIAYGHNRYEYSAWRQYLNSSKPRGEWWERKHAGQMPPAGGDTRGYLAGCSAALLAAVKRVKVTTYAASGEGGDVYGLFDYFFLPSGTEMNGNVNTNEGYPAKYWVDRMGTVQDNNANAGRVIRKVTAKTGGGVNVWLRSAYRSSWNYPWYVVSGGQLYNSNANAQYAGCPACVIY